MDRDPYLSGLRLWGDDFSGEQIAAWFEDEREAYADELGGAAGGPEGYSYHALNTRHGFRHLPPSAFRRAVGLGSAFGGEFLPIVDRVGSIVIVEPSASMRSPDLRGVPLQYAEPTPSGDLPFPAASFDLALCFGVLHHIPNVSHVVSELGRVLQPGGWALIREPVISMGDWRGQRKPGITRRERGIPQHLLRSMVDSAGFDVMRETLCMFPTTGRLGRKWKSLGPNAALGVLVDRGLSAATTWNLRYHATTGWSKIRPTSVFLVLRRREDHR
jgi:SAM-dependent methyltransferase